MEREPSTGRSGRPVALWLPVLVWAAVIFAFSSVPDLGTGLGTWDTVLRKLAHTVEYAILGALLLRALNRTGRGRPGRGRPGPAFALAVAYAVTDETHQHFVAGRHAAPLDVLIDSVGALLGVIAWQRLMSRADSDDRF